VFLVYCQQRGILKIAGFFKGLKVNIHNPRSLLQISLTTAKQDENLYPQPFQPVVVLNPDYAVDTYCGLKNLAATLVSRFCFSTYL